MQCPTCGQEVREGIAFCENCGTPVTSETVPEPKKKKGWLLPVILGVVLIAAVAVFLLWFLGDSRAYSQAQALYDKGQYTEAETAFRALGDYKDSADKVTECRYQQAKAVLEQGNYEEAEALFTELGSYADSEDQVKECRYQQAKAALDKKEYEKAAEMFAALGSYKDSEELAAKAQAALLVGTWKGQFNLVEFGGDKLGDSAAYLKDVNADMTLELREDGTFTLKFDGSKMKDAVKAGLRAYLEDMLKENGLTVAMFESYTGVKIDTYIDMLTSDLDLSAFNRSLSGKYTESNGKLSLTVDGGKTLSGTWSGNQLTVDAEGLGILKFTRK